MQPGEIAHEIKAYPISGGYESRPRCRDFFGNYHQPRGRGKSKSEAIRNARAAANELIKSSAGVATMTRDTKLAKLLDLFIERERLRGKLKKSTLDMYLREIERSEDPRGNQAAIKIKPSIGNLSIREANTPRMDAYMITLMDKGHTSKALTQWSVLSGALDIAVRFGLVDNNPMDGTIKPDRDNDEPEAIEHVEFDAFLDQVQAWCDGKDIPGTPGRHHKGGTARDRRIYWVVVLFLETGVRPGELLGFRREDFEPDADVPGIWVRGKLAYKGSGEGWRWEAGTKTGPKGIRRLGLTERGVTAVGKLLSYGINSDDDLIIPSPRGKGWNPNNFNEIWRAVRGSNFATVTPTQIRHRVGTDVRQASGIGAAAAQLGNSEAVAQRHYAARNKEVDNRSALERQPVPVPDDPG